MAKLSLLSKHIVLTEFNNQIQIYPLSGAILIEDGTISEIILEPIYDSKLLLEKYSSWNPIDYSDYYISPGIIDLNTKIEWENYSQLTLESLKGGVTCIAIESGHYQSAHPIEDLYCDVCLISTVNESINTLPESTFALKAYLYPPAPEIKSITNLDHILKFAASYSLPLIINPTMPDPRMLYMASPHRLDSVEERSKQDTNSASTAFAAAYPEALDSSSSENIDSEEENPILKSTSLEVNKYQAIVKHKRSVSGIKDEKETTITIIEEETPCDVETFHKHRKNSHDIYQDLDHRIKERQKSLADLCQAETSTYKYSGSTNFLSIEMPKKSVSMTLLAGLEWNSPDTQPDSGRKKFRPLPIQIKSAVKPDINREYNYYLANCPESWETSGVEKVLELAHPNLPIHFSGVSSAAALNLIRNSKAKFKHLSSEIPASHLCFTSLSVEPGDTRFKSAPPIRNQGNCNLLWDLLKMKGIDHICSAHSFITPSLKMTENFLKSISGIPAAGLSLATVWNMLNIPVSSPDQLEHYIIRLSKWLSLHPAKVLKINSSRGKIEKGLRADLIVWDPWVKYSLGCDYRYRETSPFMKQEMMGKVFKVYIKGQLVFDNGEVRALGCVLNRKSFNK